MKLWYYEAEDENDVAMKELLAENGFRFLSDDAIEESERIPEVISKAK